MAPITFPIRSAAAGRGYVAFSAVRFEWAGLETRRLKRLLYEIGAGDAEADRRHMPAPHDISDIFDELHRRSDVDRDEMAQLEFMYIPVFDHSRHGIPNLERRLAGSPIDFVRFLALMCNREDDGQDPPDWRIGDPEMRRHVASRACRLLQRANRIPGTGDDGAVDTEALQRWVSETRQLCAKFGRIEAGDGFIGQLLSRAPGGEDGIRPSLAVSAVLEEVGSSEIRLGFAIGVFNGRGVTTGAVGEGGMQERELARQFENWASQRAPDFPFVGSILKAVAADYDRDARREDEKVRIERRLGY